MVDRLFGTIESSKGSEMPWDIKCFRGENAEQLVDYVILAEFDIDTGSTVRHQYPSEVPGYKADWFAEYMLPEGAHNRLTDATYIFLNRNEKQVDEQFWISPGESKTIHDPSKRFLYGLNIVRNQRDETVRRGAVVKAIAIFSRYHFVEIFRQVLIKGLDLYYENPSKDILEEIYIQLNAIDMTNIPRPNIIEINMMHRGIAITPTGKDVSEHTPGKWKYATEITLQDIVIPIVIPLHCTPDQVKVTSTLTSAVTDIATSVNSTSTPLAPPVPTSLNTIMSSASFSMPSTSITSSVTSNVPPLIVKEFGPISFLIRIFQENTMKIYHHLLTKKRIIIVGYDHAAEDVCNMVLAAVNMIAPPVPNVVRRAYPYANLSDLSFLEVDGFLAGVTNPMFQNRNTWWDLLCVMDLPNCKGTVQTAEEHRLEEAQLKGKSYTPAARLPEEMLHEGLDSKFITKVMSGLENGMSESWVKQQFYEYTHSILLQAFDGDRLNNSRISDKTRRLYEANAYRVKKLKLTSEFLAIPPSPWLWVPSNQLNGVDEQLLITQLRSLMIKNNLHPLEVQGIFSDLDRGLHTEEALQVLLVYLPECSGGITLVASGLLHSDIQVRRDAVRLLQRLESFVSTRPAFDAMNQFLKCALERQTVKMTPAFIRQESS